MGIENHILKPQYKDWNQDWLNLEEGSEQLCYHMA